MAGKIAATLTVTMPSYSLTTVMEDQMPEVVRLIEALERATGHPVVTAVSLKRQAR